MDQDYIYQLKSSVNIALTILWTMRKSSIWAISYKRTTGDTVFTPPDLTKDRKDWKKQIFDIQK